jgi:hypothetical protein
MHSTFLTLPTAFFGNDAPAPAVDIEDEVPSSFESGSGGQSGQCVVARTEDEIPCTFESGSGGQSGQCIVASARPMDGAWLAAPLQQYADVDKCSDLEGLV